MNPFHGMTKGKRKPHIAYNPLKRRTIFFIKSKIPIIFVKLRRNFMKNFDKN